MGQASAQAVGFPAYHAVRAHGAFLDFGKELAPLVLGNTEGASSHAIATSHATGFFIDDRALRGLAKSGDGAYGSAGGIGAIHAEPPHVLFAFGEYDGVFVLGLVIFRGDGVVVDRVCFCRRTPVRIACS